MFNIICRNMPFYMMNSHQVVCLLHMQSPLPLQRQQEVHPQVLVHMSLRQLVMSSKSHSCFFKCFSYYLINFLYMLSRCNFRYNTTIQCMKCQSEKNITLDSTSRPFFTTDAAVSSQELSIAKIKTSFAFSTLIMLSSLLLSYTSYLSSGKYQFYRHACLLPQQHAGKISLTSSIYSSGLRQVTDYNVSATILLLLHHGQALPLHKTSYAYTPVLFSVYLFPRTFLHR